MVKIKAIPDYEGLYEASSKGGIRSIDRIIKTTSGYSKFFKGKEIYKAPNKNVHYFMVTLWKNNIADNQYVHRLIAKTFIPNPENKLEVNHIDGNRQNNNILNLEWCTRSENIDHAIKTDLRVYTNRLTENDFLDCLHAILAGESYLKLTKRVPYKVPFLSIKIRKIAKKYNIEHLLDAALYTQKVERAKLNGQKNYK